MEIIFTWKKWLISPYSFAHAFFLINTCGIYVIAWTKREIWLERDGGNETISNTSIVYISVYIKNTENDERRMLLNVSSSFSNWHLDFDWFDFPSYHKFPGNFLEIPFDLQYNTRQQTSMCVLRVQKTTPARFYEIHELFAKWCCAKHL